MEAGKDDTDRAIEGDADNEQTMYSGEILGMVQEAFPTRWHTL